MLSYLSCIDRLYCTQLLIAFCSSMIRFSVDVTSWAAEHWLISFCNATADSGMNGTLLRYSCLLLIFARLVDAVHICIVSALVKETQVD